MSGYLSGLAILVWGSIGLVVAIVTGAIGGKKGFRGALVVMWGVIPLGLMAYGKFTELQAERLAAKLRKEYRALCEMPNREVVKRTVQNVEDVAVWPAKGPRDPWENDLFFPARTTADEWIKGRDGGRYGGYRRAKLVAPESKEGGTPKYQIVFHELHAGVVDGKPFIRGAHIKVFDKHSNELLGERRDYVGQPNFGFPHGCDSTQRGPSDKWFLDNLAFIHKVLNPPPGVHVIQKELPTIVGKPVAERIPKTVTATVVRETMASKVDMFVAIEQTLPKNIRYQPMYRGFSTDMRMTDRTIVFMLDGRDVSVSQGLSPHCDLLAFASDDNQYVALFWIDNREYLLLRNFGADGALLDESKVELPRSLGEITFLNSPDKILAVEPSRYRIRVSLNPRNGQFERDVELAISRSTPTKRTRERSGAI